MRYLQPGVPVPTGPDTDALVAEWVLDQPTIAQALVQASLIAAAMRAAAAGDLDVVMPEE